jgi:hypothetical protein
MKKVFLGFIFLFPGIFIIESIYQNNIDACQRSGPVVLSYTCKISDYIIRAQAIEYKKKPKDLNVYTTGVPDSKVRFNILEVLKGDSISGSFTLNGYNFVRPNGRSGSCYANTYKKGAEYLLFMKKTPKGYTVNIDPLAPVNEQLHTSDDPWVYYIKGLVSGLNASKNKKK